MRAFLLSLLFLSSSMAQASISDRIARRLENGEERTVAAEAYSNMFAFAQKEMQKDGRWIAAAALKNEWESHYRYEVLGVYQDTGDHEPMSEWIAKLYAALEDEFGVKWMEATHLRDIWVLNYTLHVVFNPYATETWCLDQLATYPLDTCAHEYRRHLAGTKYIRLDPFATAYLHHGFSGVVTYWIVFGACEAATYGAGWALVCSPVATAAEDAFELFFAPKLAEKIWASRN